MSIHAKILKYIVPFHLNLNSEIEYQNILSVIRNSVEDNEKRWTECASVVDEKDIYNHIDSLISEDAINNSNIGNCFKQADIILDKSIKLVYVKNEQKKPFVISDKGLYFFRTGVGFLWYEVELGKGFTDEDIIDFQETFKEVSFNNNRQGIFCYREMIVPEAIANSYKKDNDSTCFHEIKDKGGNIRVNCKGVIAFSIAKWICEQLRDLGDVAFFPERNYSNIKIPDKPILYSYIIYEKIKNKYSDNDYYDNIYDNIYYLTNGFNNKYKRIINFKEQLFEPFKDAYWYVSQAGCGYHVVLDENSNNAFFKDTMINRMNTYFYLYIVILHQYYGLLYYNERIAKLPAVLDDYERKEVQVKLQNILASVNLFMMKDMFSQVSHITHQNDYNNYIRNCLRIDELIYEMKEGLDTVNGMVKYYEIITKKINDKKEQQEKERLEEERKRQEKAEQLEEAKKEKKIKLFMSIFTVVGALFVVLQTYANSLQIYDAFVDENEITKEWIINGMIPLGVAITIGLILWVLIILREKKARR